MKTTWGTIFLLRAPPRGQFRGGTGMKDTLFVALLLMLKLSTLKQYNAGKDIS